MPDKKTKRRPKKGTLAELMLRELESRYPGGPTTGELAVLLYDEDTPENRRKVRGVARTVRGWGFHAYGFGGIYRLCDSEPEKLSEVAVRNGRTAGGIMLNLIEIVEAVSEAGAPEMASEVRLQLREMLLELLNRF